MKSGRKSIDMRRVSRRKLRQMGINPDLSKQKIGRLLKVGGENIHLTYTQFSKFIRIIYTRFILFDFV